jgi:multimeric flavodoxin WrbA
MKILAINSSHRGDKGYTHFLIGKLFQGAQEAGAECEEVILSKLKIDRCLSCGVCQTSRHYLRCVNEDKDDVRMVFQKMAAADLIVYATPIYLFNMTGLLKTFLDRMYGTGGVNDLRIADSGLLFHHIDNEVCSKPFVTLICCNNIEFETPKNVISYFKTFSKFMNAPQVGSLYRNAGILTNYGEDSEKEKLFLKILDVYKAYQQAGCELAVDGHIHKSTQKRANQEIIPFPFFGMIKRLPFIKPIKQRFIVESNRMMGMENERLPGG